jgi:phosphoribosylformimino-5-aminoimidazole carboxamide ribotide isomerase
MLTGANTQNLADLANRFPEIQFIASGGISSLDDIGQLLDLNLPNLQGIITGKALYEKRFSLTDAIKLTKNEDTR